MIGALIVVFITAGIVCIVKKWKKRVEQRQGSSTVNYQNIIAVLIDSVKQLNDKIEILENNQ